MSSGSGAVSRGGKNVRAGAALKADGSGTLPYMKKNRDTLNSCWNDKLRRDF